MSTRIIAVGNISAEAEQYLLAHGAKKLFTESYVDLIELPSTVYVLKDGYDWRYWIHFGEEEFPFYCVMELYADAAETSIALEKASDYERSEP